jgi:hypothetical protein
LAILRSVVWKDKGRVSSRSDDMTVAGRIYPPVWIIGGCHVAERRLNWLNGWFQSSLRDELDCRCLIHGMNPVATVKASLRDAASRLLRGHYAI